MAAVQPLLLAGNGQKDDGGWELEPAQDAGALQADGSAAAIVVGAGGVAIHVESVAVARIIMAGYEHNPLGILRLCSLEDSVNIGNFGGLRNAIGRRFSEAVGLYFEAAAAIFGISFKFRLDPFAGRANATA